MNTFFLQVCSVIIIVLKPYVKGKVDYILNFYSYRYALLKSILIFLDFNVL